MMIYKFLGLFFLLASLGNPNEVEVIPWSESEQLSWSLFKANPKMGTPAAALTASGIRFQYSMKMSGNTVLGFEPKIHAHFYPEKSWYIKGKATDHILAHEQRHFDITELYARKFRLEIKKVPITNHLKSDLERLHQDILKALSETQKRYDAETDHSVNKAQQAKWDMFIKVELDKLDAFKSKA